MSEQFVIDDGPCFTEEGQFCDPEFVVLEENPTVNITEVDGWRQLMVNPEVIPLSNEEFSVDPVEIDQEIMIADTEAVIYA